MFVANVTSLFSWFLSEYDWQLVHHQWVQSNHLTSKSEEDNLPTTFVCEIAWEHENCEHFNKETQSIYGDINNKVTFMATQMVFSKQILSRLGKQLTIK